MSVDHHNSHATLDSIYQRILGRSVDISGIKTYSAILNQPRGRHIVEQALYSSAEYKNKSQQKKKYKPKIEIIDGNIFNTTNNYPATKKVLLLTLANNIEQFKSYTHIHTFFYDLKNIFSAVKFGIFTNNNSDQTERILNEWAKQDPDILVSKGKDEDIYTTHNNRLGNRIHKLAGYRSSILNDSLSYFNDNFDYIIVFDSDIYAKINIDHIVASISIDTKWSSISANTCFVNSIFHYDTLALRFINQEIDIKKIYPDFDKFYGSAYYWNHTLYVLNNFVEVQSAFGGLTIYHADEIVDLCKHHKNIYSVADMPEATCEHIAVATKLKHKKYVNSDMFISNKDLLVPIIDNAPTVFIPRDAGFFSVFNFLIGSISNGNQTYPLFNQTEFLKHRDTNQHFCYWTDSYNSWFDFFEPIRYHKNDTMHSSMDLKDKTAVYGEDAPPEFRLPQITKKLLTDNEKTFSDWRKNTHKIYKQYIHLKPEINEKINDLFNKMFDNDKPSYIIGVHYRHPSHHVESGPVFLQQYFDKIDEIMIYRQDAQIFLASDTDFGILGFKQKYGDKVKYIESVQRLPLDNILSWAFALASGKKPDNVGIIDGKGYQLHNKRSSENQPNNYQLILDLLSEVVCLSKTNILINSTSNISLAISYMNPDIKTITLS